MEDFVPFEIAKKLKEKGFQEKCLLHHESSIDTYDRPNQELDYSDFLKCFNEGNSIGLIDAPTISQVLKWLREKKEIIVIPLYSINTSWWSCVVFNADSLDPHELSSLSNSYEQAALAGIEYVIDNLP